MVASADLVVRIITDTSKAQGLDQTSSKASKFSKGLATASKAAAGALLVVGAAAVKAGQAAAEDAKSQALLANSMKNSAGATSRPQIAATEDMIAKMSLASGVADDGALRPAMGALVRATGDTAKSQEALAIAMDVAAATGKPLQSVSEAMAKGFGGTTTSLGRLVPGLDKATLASGDMDKIMGELARTTKGASADAANTAAGKMDRMTVAMNEAEESIGAALLPAMAKLADILGKLATYAAKHPKLFQAIAAAVVILSVAIIGLMVALKVYTTVTRIAGIVSAASWSATLGPILLVVAAVALVVGAIILLWKKSETFRKVVKGVWAAIKAGARAVASFVKSAWQKVWKAISGAAQSFAKVVRAVFLAIKGAVSAVISWLRSAWQAVLARIKAMVHGFKEAVVAVWRALKSAIGTVVDGIKSVWSGAIDRIKGAVSGLGAILSGPFDVVKGAINAVKSAIDAVIDAVGDLIGSISRIDFPNIPNLNPFSRAAAPAVAGPGVATFGAPMVPTARATSSGGGGGPTIIIQGALDPEAVARQIQRLLGNHQRRVTGRAPA